MSTKNGSLLVQEGASFLKYAQTKAHTHTMHRAHTDTQIVSTHICTYTQHKARIQGTHTHKVYVYVHIQTTLIYTKQTQ